MTSVLVLGLGAMGSAAAQHLAMRGHCVIGFDRYAPPHTYGSSHGQTRIIRQSYWEDPRYVPMLLRAYELWRDLEAKTGLSLLRLTGGIMIGPKAGDLVARSTKSAEQFRLPHKVLSAAEIRRLYPVFTVEENTAALWEDAAGYLSPENCVDAQLRQAERAGAELHYNEPVIEWMPMPGGGVSVTTARGSYKADRIILTAGPWAPQVLSNMALPLAVTRQVLFWFQPAKNAELFNEGRLPVFLVESVEREPMLYGFPSLAAPLSPAGVKVALHGSDNHCTPENIARSILPDDELGMRERLSRSMPWLNGQLIHAETCLYTMTPDEHFILDQHPEYPQVTIGAGFSGHGFKFAPVIGEILADLASDRKPGYDLDLFSVRRFSQQRSL